MTKKMTKVEMFKALLENYAFTEEEVKFINREIELIEKKNSNRKPTKAQEENAIIKEQIIEFLKSGNAHTVGEIQKAVGLESNQKTSALVRQLKEVGLVVRKEEKGKAYFSLA